MLSVMDLKSYQISVFLVLKVSFEHSQHTLEISLFSDKFFRTKTEFQNRHFGPEFTLLSAILIVKAVSFSFQTSI